MLIPGSSTCCNKRNRQGCQCTTTTKGREGRGGMGCGRSCVSSPPPIAGHGVGRETTDPAWREGGKGGRRFGGDFLYREESCIPPSSCPDPLEKYNKSLTHPRGPSGLKLLRAPSSRPFPPPREAAPARPGPALPRRCARSRARGKESTKERGAARGRGGPRTPRSPGLPHYCPLAGSAVAATAGVRAAESRRD